ncbi:hypothetical protein CSC73_16270 [Pseudoxanthomonas sacheonensis]|nr:hypothetical protein CSC73_16270 [Pseudoxanthomonas sacheonensis]
MTTAEIAAGIKDKSGGHLVRMYENYTRFPGRERFVCLIELAELRGITLVARDFIPPASEIACEDSVSKPARSKRKKG